MNADVSREEFDQLRAEVAELKRAVASMSYSQAVASGAPIVLAAADPLDSTRAYERSIQREEDQRRREAEGRQAFLAQQAKDEERRQRSLPLQYPNIDDEVPEPIVTHHR